MGSGVGRRLIVCEQGYRGSAETQFADVLYIIRELTRQLSDPGVDLALRGLAVTWALEAGPVPAVTLGERCLDTLPDPRATVVMLLAEGVSVSVEEPDLRALGADPGGLMSGIECLQRGELVSRWGRYEGIWFM
jgi:hypothetical protein